MDGDGSAFAFSGVDFGKGQQDSSDPLSWGDIFLDEIHSEDTGQSTPGISDGTILQDSIVQQTSINGNLQMQFSQPQINQAQVLNDDISIPTHLQGSLTNNVVQQSSTSNLNTGVAYVTHSQPSQKQLNSGGNAIQNVLGTNQTQQLPVVSTQQSGTKLVQIAPSFPVATVGQVQQLSTNVGVPLQTLLQQNQTLPTQQIYGNQNTGLFPAQGSVHIENPKVVNVNFGPHVIQSDGSGQHAIIQTSQGKRVIIANSQIPQMHQSINLAQPLVGTQLINPQNSSSAVGNVIRATATQPAQTMVTSTTGNNAQQIILPSGQTVIPRNTTTGQASIAKNVVLRHINPTIQPVIYHGGQNNVAGQLLQQQSALIASSNNGLQMMNNATANQTGQVQLITQPQINQQTTGQQLNQNALMNLLGGQGMLSNAGNTLSGLVPGQNILVNGQMININQLGNLVSQLQVPQNATAAAVGTVTNSGIASASLTNRTIQPNTQPIVVQQNNQPQLVIQPKNIQTSLQQQPKSIRTPTPTAGSTPSTPIPISTPSTPTPTPTPDLTDFDGSSGKSSSANNILQQALEMSDIDLEDEGLLFDSEIFSSTTPSPIAPDLKIKPLQKQKTKPIAKAKSLQATISVSNNSLVSKPVAKNQNTVANNQQKIISANGQVYVISGQKLVLQQSNRSTESKNNFENQVLSNVSKNTEISSGASVLQIKKPQQVAVKPQINSLGNNQRTAAFAKIINKSSSPVPTHPFIISSTKSSLATLNASLNSSSQSKAHIVTVKNQKISTLSGSYIKQEPVEEKTISIEPQSVVPKAEIDEKFAISTPPSSSRVSSIPQFSTTTIISSSTVSQPMLINSIAQSISCSSLTMTTQSHQSGLVSSAPLSITKSSFITTSILTPVSSSSSTVPNQNTKNSPNPKANQKVMTPIKIADTTLTLSLTPEQKEKLEEHLSRMSLHDQTKFLRHQQSIIKRTMKVQETQQQRQMHYQNQKPLLQEQQKKSAINKTIDSSEPNYNLNPSLPLTVQEMIGKSNNQNFEAPSKPEVSISEQSVETHIKQQNSKTVSNDTTQSTQQGPVYKTHKQASSQAQLPEPVYQPKPALSTPAVYNRTLAEQQLYRDRSLAIAPDLKTDFKNYSDAMRRLVRFHTLQDHKPDENAFETQEWDRKYSEVCSYLVQKKKFLMKKFCKLSLYQDMLPEKGLESIQNLTCFNDDLRDTIYSEKESAKNFPETFRPVDFSKPPKKREEPEVVYENDSMTSEEEDVEEAYSVSSPELSPSPSTVKSHSQSQSPLHRSHKRKADEQVTTGTLKLVFKRRTTDNFTVQNTSDKRNNDLCKSIVDVDRNDGEYKFDDLGGDYKRRRSSSIVSRGASESIVSRGSSIISNQGEESDSDNVDPDSDIVKSNTFPNYKFKSKHSNHISLDETFIGYSSSAQPRVPHYSEISAAESSFEGKFPPRHSLTSITSDEVFNSSAIPYQSSCSSATDRPAYTLSKDSSVDRAFRLHSSISSSSSQTYNVESSVAKMASLTTSPFFTTPNKSLLQTDAMFNFSDDEMEDRSDKKLMNSFELEKDPQKNMINDSVRTAINSVLNEDEDEGDSDLDVAVHSILNS